MKNILTVLCALASMLLISSCVQNNTICYHKIVYEVSSSPAVNMDIHFINSGNESYMTPAVGSFFSQECPGIISGWRAYISASAIPNPDYPVETRITIKIFLDDVLVTQTTDQDRAQLEYIVPE